MAIDKYSHLKIAANILNTTIQAMAEELDVTSQSIKGVCDGNITSARIEKYVNQKIIEADDIYDQHRRNRNLHRATA